MLSAPELLTSGPRTKVVTGELWLQSFEEVLTLKLAGLRLDLNALSETCPLQISGEKPSGTEVKNIDGGMTRRKNIHDAVCVSCPKM